MSHAARTTDPITAHSPCAPGQCGPGSNNVIIQNLPAYRVGDSTLPHGIPQGSPPSCVPHVTALVQGSHNVFINGQPAGRVTDAHSCGIRVVSGANKVDINGGGSASRAGNPHIDVSASGRSASGESGIGTGGGGTNYIPSDLSSFIKSKEGFTSCAFWDVSQYTNGYGTKADSSTECISEAEGLRRLDADITTRKNYVVTYGQNNGYNWSNDQVNSLTSFAYNLGLGSIAQVTDNGTRTDAVIGEKIKLYNKADGKVVDGLTIRRNEESAWFIRGIT